jgi:hypothetical protein
MLPTPVAQTGNGGPKGLDGGSGARQMLADAGFPRAAGAPSSLPTPKACDGERGRDKARARPGTKGRELATVVRDQMLPTPRANSAMTVDLRTQQNRPELQPNLETVVARMLPTPSAGLFNDSEDPQSWLERRERVKLTANNGNGMGMPLAVAVKLLPTPTTNDSKNASLPPSQAERDGLAGAMLRDDSIPTGAATYLNPSFVEEMMGFPVGWTA